METMLIAELDEDATEPWVQSKSDYGWSVDRGPGKSYVRWGAESFPFDRKLGHGDSSYWDWHWFSYRLQKDGQEFYVVSGQALPAYEQVKLFHMPIDHSTHAFAGYRQGQWYACQNGLELFSADDIITINISPTGGRVAFQMKKGADVFIQEQGQIGPMFEKISDLRFSEAAHFLAYVGLRDGQEYFVLNHELQFSVPQGSHFIDYVFSLQGKRWVCFYGEESYPESLATVVADGEVLSRRAEYDIDHWWSHDYFSPDESSLAFPIKTTSGESALWHDGKEYVATSSSTARLCGWLPDNVPGWMSLDEAAGWSFHAGHDSGALTRLRIIDEAHIGSGGSYACKGTPRDQEEDYPKVLVKDGRILMKADYILIEISYEAVYPFEKHLVFQYGNCEKPRRLFLAVDEATLFSGFDGFHRLHCSPNGECFACHGTQDKRSFLIVDAQAYGPFDDVHHTDFSPDNMHWCGVVKKNEKWLVLLDGVIIDQLDYFDRVGQEFGIHIPLHMFTEDNQWCHYHGVEGNKMVYRRISLLNE